MSAAIAPLSGPQRSEDTRSGTASVASRLDLGESQIRRREWSARFGRVSV